MDTQISLQNSNDHLGKEMRAKNMKSFLKNKIKLKKSYRGSGCITTIFSFAFIMSAASTQYDPATLSYSSTDSNLVWEEQRYGS